MNAFRLRQLSGSVILLMLLFAAYAHAQTPVLLWDANQEPPAIAGYQVLSGPTSGTYTVTVSVGKVTSYVLPATTVPTYFAVKAVGTDGLISGPSAEVVYTPPVPVPVPTPTPTPVPVPTPVPTPAPAGCPNGTVLSPTNTLWTFTVKPNTKANYTNYVLGLGGWTLLQSRSSSGGNWLLQFRCDR